jgi:hypothetical protein
LFSLAELVIYFSSKLELPSKIHDSVTSQAALTVNNSMKAEITKVPHYQHLNGRYEFVSKENFTEGFLIWYLPQFLRWSVPQDQLHLYGVLSGIA